jgi:formate dehydrogenase (NADP+) beta subunit
MEALAASIVKAIASGQKAALSIDRYLKGENKIITTQIKPIARLPGETIQNIKNIKRHELPTLPVEKRKKNFELVETGYSKETSIREANRCLNCGAGAKIHDIDKCAACLTCVRCCPYKAASNTRGDIEIVTERCLACGLCSTECPARAIGLDTPGFLDIDCCIQEALKKPRLGNSILVGFFCSYGFLGSMYRTSNYSSVNWLAVPCLSRIATRHILKAFELGASGVLIIGCTDEECRYQEATTWMQLKLDEAREILNQAGFNKDDLKLFTPKTGDAKELKNLITGFINTLSNRNTRITGGGS